MAREQSLRRFGVLLLVAGAHVLLLLLPLDAERGKLEGGAPTSQLFFLRTPEVERGRQSDLRQLAEPAIKTNIEIMAPPAITVVSPAGVPAAGSAATPPINWSEEARRAAADAADKMPSHPRSKCDSTAAGDPALPNCKPPPAFKWAPPKAGFVGGMPYVRVGERCVVTIGLFSCGLGTPSVDGTLFDGMDEPDRDRSSVPESR